MYFQVIPLFSPGETFVPKSIEVIHKYISNSIKFSFKILIDNNVSGVKIKSYDLVLDV